MCLASGKLRNNQIFYLGIWRNAFGFTSVCCKVASSVIKEPWILDMFQRRNPVASVFICILNSLPRPASAVVWYVFLVRYSAWVSEHTVVWRDNHISQRHGLSWRQGGLLWVSEHNWQQSFDLCFIGTFCVYGQDLLRHGTVLSILLVSFVLVSPLCPAVAFLTELFTMYYVLSVDVA